MKSVTKHGRPPLDCSGAGSIIKDVMIRQLREDKKDKKDNIPTVYTDWLARNLSLELSTDDDIDTTDFFDPEEFSIGRHNVESPRP